ncbi:DUF3658 domain-containing protein [Clostridium sp.]|uniref:DUF3658 domain-containing protein n=1 Tax=Clostridium sp. TaxID=1506 RepID=UPI001EBC9571|nr:DUF3658 domain-containing protein [Clostridium sp.]MBS5883879.1 DUF1835 domain-containing protein [Clostridium sp.]MDU7240598.1 DUF3658 domain-containing protein [Clostridium sp.]
MIEVVFRESEGGILKIAKKHYRSNYDDEAISYFENESNKEKNNKTSNSKSISNNISKVICIPFMLDIGDISIPITSEYRRNLILNMYTINGIENEDTLEFGELWKRYVTEIKKLEEYAAKGEELRIWYSGAAYSLCGLYYVCNILKKYKCKISVIKLPSYIKSSENGIQIFTSWSEVNPKYVFSFLPLEKELSYFEIQCFATMWNELIEDDSKLRSIVNGSLIGVPEDFYDNIIRNEIPDNEFTLIALIGKILSKYQIAVEDWWYAERIRYMIKKGELIVVRGHKKFYNQVLKKR